MGVSGGDPAARDSALLVFQVNDRVCALPLPYVAETMRPLRIDPVPGAPPFVAGASVIRGDIAPVVDMGAFLGGVALRSPSRLIAVRSGDRPIVGALVSAVLSIRDRRDLRLEQLPGLLESVAAGFVEAVARLDDGFLSILRAGAWVPDEVWQGLMTAETGS